ncbi:MAG: hypothetical protein GOU97_03085 [Nanoarchaeota archaeon]|nr:hypothetical protein [Nanoarchaeota archaeon]
MESYGQMHLELAVLMHSRDSYPIPKFERSPSRLITAAAYILREKTGGRLFGWLKPNNPRDFKDEFIVDTVSSWRLLGGLETEKNSLKPTKMLTELLLGWQDSEHACQIAEDVAIDALDVLDLGDEEVIRRARKMFESDLDYPESFRKYK